MTSRILTELVQAATLVTYTLDVPGSNLDRDADCLNCSFFVVLFAVCRQIPR
jgi:hypothetical protein